jgi:F0F1-type ATP synthase delta subunit
VDLAVSKRYASALFDIANESSAAESKLEEELNVDKTSISK